MANSKHDYYPKRNYDKRVGARITSQKIETMNNSVFLEKTLQVVIKYRVFFWKASLNNSIQSGLKRELPEKKL